MEGNEQLDQNQSYLINKTPIVKCQGVVLQKLKFNLTGELSSNSLKKFPQQNYQVKPVSEFNFNSIQNQENYQFFQEQNYEKVKNDVIQREEHSVQKKPKIDINEQSQLRNQVIRIQKSPHNKNLQYSEQYQQEKKIPLQQIQSKLKKISELLIELKDKKQKLDRESQMTQLELDKLQTLCNIAMQKKKLNEDFRESIKFRQFGDINQEIYDEYGVSDDDKSSLEGPLSQQQNIKKIFKENPNIKEIVAANNNRNKREFIIELYNKIDNRPYEIFSFQKCKQECPIKLIQFYQEHSRTKGKTYSAL